jgi:putative ABC transport system ATP-binding protein
MLIEVNNLVAGYGGTTVLRIDALQVERGEHTLLLGPSGCGKTTLLNILAGLTAPLNGEVRVDSAFPANMSAAERDQFRGKTIGLVMQRLHLIRALTVEANLKLTQRLAGRPVDAPRIHEVLATLGIADKLKAFPRALSQGEAQRVAIARAVINHPPLILADEPTSALDDKNCEAAIDLLFTQARSHGATLIVATHDARIKSRFSRVVNL